MHIRSELRKKKMYKVSVERVVNVQGMSFSHRLIECIVYFLNWHTSVDKAAVNGIRK